ncbi:MAG: hypothetical protein BAJATHORv1_30023 [Candidatus Thorarchaeota archaeon]|nr:MAG: hypothetical protein BAJATHORv1_30023 [Candidatus Thorarchaeota archaeon]
MSDSEQGKSGALLIHELKQVDDTIKTRAIGKETVQIRITPEQLRELVEMLDRLYSDIFPENLIGIDFEEDGFEIIYYFWSRNSRVLCKIVLKLPADSPEVPTIADIFPGMEWHERETHEMFGINFSGHPDLRLLLLPDELKGEFPLRKSFEIDRSRIHESGLTQRRPGPSEGGEDE